MARNYIPRTESERAFKKTFDSLCYRHNPWTVWRDFVNMTACAIANRFECNTPAWKRREESYLASAKAYTAEELALFSQLFATTVEALDKNPAQDFLGNLYMNLDFGSGWSGQFFTPWNVAEMMARMTISEKLKADIDSKGYVSICDPAGGAGCTLMAAAHVLLNEHKINYQQSALFVAQDIDPVVAQMCYIQLSLLGCPGYVVVGDSLAKPTVGKPLFPVVHEGNEIWFTPMWYSETWTIRIIAERCRELFG